MNPIRTTRNWASFLIPTVGEGVPAVIECLHSGTGGAAHRHMHRWCVRACDNLGIRRAIVNADILDSAPQAVIVANHQSLLDILVLGSFLDRDYRWLAKSELFKVPIMGWYLALAGHVPVYRGSQRHRNRDVGRLIHGVVEQGASLLFFPEGTRSADQQLQPFHAGAFRAAARERLPVLPLVVRGTGALLRKGALDLEIHADGECSVTVLPPLAPPPGDDEATVVDELRESVFRRMKATLDASS